MSENSQPWLIASDVDGTLFDHSLVVDPRVREAVAAAMAAGNVVTLATGRMHRATHPFARDLGFDTPLICYQGAMIRRDHELWLHQPLSLDIARDAIATAQQRGFHMNAYVDDILYVDQQTNELTVYTDLSPMSEPRAVGNLAEFLTGEPTKLLFICPEEETESFLHYAEGRWGNVAQVVQSHRRFVELTHPAASKGAAILFLAERLGIPRERILAVGDNHNDISMLTAAGVGVAMGNASAAVKAFADWVAPDVAHGGLAAAIHHFVL